MRSGADVKIKGKVKVEVKVEVLVEVKGEVKACAPNVSWRAREKNPGLNLYLLLFSNYSNKVKYCPEYLNKNIKSKEKSKKK